MRLYSLFLLTAFGLPSFADVVTDGSMGPSGAIARDANNTYAITEAHGTINGKNLYHSFSTFDVNTGETARFSSTSSVENIVARVTGAGPSNINGMIASDVPNANLWLINPKGILFGKDASIDIKGSFYTSTADYLRFDDGSRFYTDLNNDSRPDALLSSAPPSAFGFLSDTSTSTAVLSLTDSVLTVPFGESINLAGRDVELKNSILKANGGKISVVSVSGSGEVIYTDGGATVMASSLGKLIYDKSRLIVEGGAQSKVQLIGGELKIDTHETDLVGNVTLVKASFFEDGQLLDKPCEITAFQGGENLTFTVSEDGGVESFGLDLSDRESELATRKQQCF